MAAPETPEPSNEGEPSCQLANGNAAIVVQKSSIAPITILEECEDGNADRVDAMAEYLLAYDGYLAGDRGEIPEMLPLPETMQASVAQGIDCLLLLSRWRATRDHQTEELAQRLFANAPGDKHRFPQSFGRFELRRLLGQGGFGVVYLAYDPVLAREVALKLPRPDCLLNEALRERFLFEGRAAAGLEHSNLIHVLEAGEIDQVCYLAMAYCVGPTLSEWIRNESTTATPVQAARLIALLADGVDHAHRRGILHRDLKPANVLLDIENLSEMEQKPVMLLASATPKITDFGLARLADGPGDFSRTGVMVGTPQYMAPEQAEGNPRAIGTHTDIHALGLILYEVLTKIRPFSAPSQMKSLRRVATEEPINPSVFRRGLPRDLASICMKCLEKTPEKRYPTAAELAADLRRFLAGEPVRARLPSPGERILKWARRRPAVAALVTVSSLAILLSIGAAVWHQHVIESQNVELQKALQDSKTLRELAATRLEEIAGNYYATQVRVVAGLHTDGQAHRMGELLNLLRPKTGETDHRDFAWHYLWRMARNEQGLRGHVAGVQKSYFSKSGELLVTADGRSVIVWDVQTGTLKHQLRAEKLDPTTLSISPDDQLVAAANSETWHKEPMKIRVWNLNTGELVASHDDGAALPGDLAFSPDSSTLAISRRPQPNDRQGVLLLWNLKTNRKQHCLGQMNFAMAAAFSPDGQTLAVSCGLETYQNKLMELDVMTLAPKASYAGNTDRILYLQYAADDKTLYSWGPDDTLRYWDRATHRERVNFLDTDPTVHQVSPSAEGRCLAILVEQPGKPKSQRIVMRDGVTGKQLGKSILHSTEVLFSIAQSPDTRLHALGTDRGKVTLVRTESTAPFEVIRAHSHEVWAVAFAPDSRSLATGSDDGTAKLWNVADAQALDTFREHQALVTCLSFSKDGRSLATASYDKNVRIWDTSANKLLATLVGHSNAVRTVAFSPDGLTLASAGRDRTIRLWDIRQQKTVAVLDKHQDDVRAVAYSPTEKTLVSVGNDRRLILWDLAAQREIKQIDEPDQMWTVAFSPDGATLAAAGADGIPHLWDKDLSGKRSMIGAHLGGVKSVAFSPDGRTLATGGLDKSLRLWHVATGQELVCFKNLPTQVNAVAFSPNGRFLAGVLHDGSLLLWQGR